MSDPTSVENRISTLRSAMAQAGVAAVIIPSTDPHQSEYIAAHWQARAHFSGFTGSAGVLVVTGTQAGLWTDSRYYLQAEQELPASIQLFKSQEAGVPTFPAWLGNILPKGAVVGMNGWLLSEKERTAKTKELEAQGLTLNVDCDPVSHAWLDRPAMPDAAVFAHPDDIAGLQRAMKLAEIRALMNSSKADHHLICTLDDIAWTLNLRGKDVEFNPVFYAYLLISQDGCTLFADEAKFSPQILRELQTDGVHVAPYNSLLETCKKLEGKVWVDPMATSCLIHQSFASATELFAAETLTIKLKSIKNKTEIEKLRGAMAKDGVALLRLFRWLESSLPFGVTELEVSDKLGEFRKEMPHYMGESFAAISGFGANGAIVHYRPGLGSSLLQKDGIFLLDSGGQYMDGTTDITRTVAIGEPTELQKRNFTLVLKGHIALATAVFPEGVAGYQLDILARIPLWSEGLNFGHGTGHGVGFFLCVHEGPQGIRHGYSERASSPILPGMITSNEPGYYEAGEYGIRIENLLLCVEKGKTAFGKFLGFETLSLFPIDLNLVEESLLTQPEVDWLNDYHQKVEDTLRPLISDEEQRWLEHQCRRI